jgi:hypothetical protein
MPTLLSIRDASDKSCRETRKTHFMFNKFLFFKSCSVRDNVEKHPHLRNIKRPRFIVARLALHVLETPHERSAWYYCTYGACDVHAG